VLLIFFAPSRSLRLCARPIPPARLVGAPLRGGLSSPTAAGVARATLPQVTEYYEVFAFHDADRDGFLSVGQFSAAVRSLGYAPTAGQLSAIHRTIDRAYPSGLTFSDFIKVMGMVVEPKVARAALTAPAILAGLEAFEQLCASRRPPQLRAAPFRRRAADAAAAPRATHLSPLSRCTQAAAA